MTSPMTHTVLVVEDEQDLRELMCQAFEMNGYAVVTARDGQEALDALPRIPHLCLVLLDLLMPGMNGWELFEIIRTRADLMGVPIVIQTSSPDQAPAGATRVLQKPVKLDKLLSVVREFCSQ